MNGYINIVGAGLAGCEAAWQIAKRGVRVRLFEMKPDKKSPAHQSDYFSELICSNSLRSNQLENAVGLLKEEMRRLDSIIISTADETKVPAGGALAVDREGFAKAITEKLMSHPNIELIRGEVKEIPQDSVTIIASGPLTSDALSEQIREFLGGSEYLYFYDASAPIVTMSSINMDRAFKAARYGKGDDDYINCPMTKEEYLAFYNALVNAEVVPLKSFEKEIVFEGCMPIETMAKRGEDTMRFGPLKPVGIVDPKTGSEPYANVQLRQDNNDGTLFNIVGFQTHLKFPEQKRVFSLIPGLEDAEFERYGVMHRNTFIKSPGILDETYCVKNKSNFYFAGQITGVEGYVESASSGLVAGINAVRNLLGRDFVLFPKTTAIGALASYVSDESVRDFQPMNVNFGIMDKLEHRVRDKKKKNYEIAMRSLGVIDQIIKSQNL